MSNGAVKDTRSKEEMKINKHNCETCNEGKQTRLLFPDKGSHANNLQEIIHTDVCGPRKKCL